MVGNGDFPYRFGGMVVRCGGWLWRGCFATDGMLGC